MDPVAKQAPQPSVDGIVRSDDAERRLNLAFSETFTSPAGSMVLDYIKSITLHTVCGPEVGGNQLFHREGMRYLAMIISERVNQGKET